MKKLLAIVVILILSGILLPSSPALAWDEPTQGSDNATAVINWFGESLTISIDSVEISGGIVTAVGQFSNIFLGLGLVVFLIVLAFWIKDSILFLVSGLVTILVSVTWITTYPGAVIVLCGLGVYQLLKAVLMTWETMGSSRGLDHFRSLYNRMKGGG